MKREAECIRVDSLSLSTTLYRQSWTIASAAADCSITVLVNGYDICSASFISTADSLKTAFVGIIFCIRVQLTATAVCACLYIFTARYTWCKARYCYRMLSVRLSVRRSVTLVICGHIGWVTTKVITWIISLGSSLLRSPNIGNPVRGKHPKMWVK